ncbi:hypothetical protein U1Q18_029105 [Sarracenia purpurea var. burkii]
MAQQILRFNLFHQMAIVFGIMTNNTIILIHQNTLVFEHETPLDSVHPYIGGGGVTHGGSGGGRGVRGMQATEGRDRGEASPTASLSESERESCGKSS